MSGILALVGLSGAPKNAKAQLAPSPEPLSFPWRVVEEQSSSFLTDNRTVEVLDHHHGDIRLRAKLLHLRRIAGSYYRFEVHVGDGLIPILQAASWDHGLERCRARAELVLSLLLDVKRLENHIVDDLGSFEMVTPEKR